jgi:hypothetical protein
MFNIGRFRLPSLRAKPQVAWQHVVLPKPYGAFRAEVRHPELKHAHMVTTYHPKLFLRVLLGRDNPLAYRPVLHREDYGFIHLSPSDMMRLYRVSKQHFAAYLASRPH